MIQFVKYHGLGNDYLVIDPAGLAAPLSEAQIRLICDRHYGAGSDGILLGPLPTGEADFALRIFNPDGSPAEKSGNGLRIFSRYLWDRGLLQSRSTGAGESAYPEEAPCSEPFTIHTPGGIVRSQVLEAGRKVTVEMGQASFDSQRIPVAGPPRQVVDESMILGGEMLRYCAVSMGNPHCVVLYEAPSEEAARRLGPLVENEPRFPYRTNVQFMRALGRDAIQIFIWERGAGYTLASGSSSCAAAAAAHRLGWVDAQVSVHNPGGVIQVSIDPDYWMTMTGPVEKVYEGSMEIE
jgi:diaminopimelate epimerase